MELHLSCNNKFCISYIYAIPKQDYNGLIGGKAEHSKPKQNRRYFHTTTNGSDDGLFAKSRSD